MKLGLYKTTGRAISVGRKLLGLELRHSGLATLPDRPILFVANHFTRFETFLVPYVVYDRYRQPVRTLATDAIFHGRFAQYLKAIGAVSTRDPRRNRKIIRDLMTGEIPWVIYPEGGLIKNKKTVENGRLHLTRGGRNAPPHTGAAILALKSEIIKRRCRAAALAGDEERLQFYADEYELDDPTLLHDVSAVVIPVNLTYPRLRAGENVLQRAARRIGGGLHPHMAEELAVEGTILFEEPALSVHFGEPIDVAEYIDGTRELARQLVGWFRRERQADLFLRRQAKRLTARSMWHVYHNTEINLDHLFCYALRAVERNELSVTEFKRALLLAVLDLREQESVRLHPLLRNGIIDLGREAPFLPLEDVAALASREGVITRQNGHFIVNRDVLIEQHDFHDIRLNKMVQVIANELEPIESAVRTVGEAVNLDAPELRERLSSAIHRCDLRRFHREYDTWHEAGVSRAPGLGEPFFLEAPNARTGIVLVHGYLACPQEIRPLAETLHEAGYGVYGVRLDGHGTAPRHLTTVSWRGWLDTVRDAVLAVRLRHERCVVGGFSFGGLLAAMAAADAGADVDRLFTINTPLKLRHPLAPLINAIFHLDRVFRVLCRVPHPRCLDTYSDSPDLNYGSDYLHSLRELRRAIRVAKRRLGGVTAPALIIQSEDDPIVLPASARMLHSRLGSSEKMIEWLPDDRHIVVRGPGREAVFERVLAFLDEAAKPVPLAEVGVTDG